MSARIAWPEVIERAADIVNGYDTGVTLRQLFYRLVSEQVLPNTTAAYKTLSKHTAEARRWGTFPGMIDRGRAIHRPVTDTSPIDALADLADTYRRDRTEGQDYALYLAVEKSGMVNQLQSWFGDLGVPILACGGYSSQSYADTIVADVLDDGRKAVLLYAGDFDPSGEDIDRDLVDRTGCWDDVIRVALTADQVESYRLPPNPGKLTDSRAAGFIARHGELVQVELDALDPNDLRDLFQRHIEPMWDTSAYDAVREQEDDERAELIAAAQWLAGDGA